MRTIALIAAASILTGCSNHQPGGTDKAATAAAAQRPPDAESEAYMRKAEVDWAEVAVRPMPGLMERILADDYVGVNSDTAVRDKAKMIALANEKPTGAYVSSKLDYVHYRHFGDTVIAQGQESLQRQYGGPDYSLIWTDVWMWRDGKWQVVASQDSVLPAKE